MKPGWLAVVPLLLAAFACATRTAPEPLLTAPDDGETARLTVKLLGLESDDGEVAVALYESAASFESRSAAIAAGRVPPREGVATWVVESLDPGVYAVAAYHDLNGNGRLDRSNLGVPSEPYGFSNDARGTFGPPGYDRAALRIDPGERVIEITLR